MPRLRYSFCILACFGCLSSSAQESANVDAKITPAIREYCHIIRFPEAWAIPKSLREPLRRFSYYDGYEFRIPGVLDTNFMVAGVVRPENELTEQKYLVDLSRPGVVPKRVNTNQWDNGTPIPLIRRSPWTRSRGNEQVAVYRGIQFPKSGIRWAASADEMRESPDQLWIVVQSYSGTEYESLSLRPQRDRDTRYFDVYNTDSGKKLIAFTASFVDINGTDALAWTGWLTERYFIVPLGRHREKCLVCEFSSRRLSK